MENNILYLVESLLANKVQNSIPNDTNRQLLTEFRDVLKSIRLSPTPKFSMMSIDQINSLLNFTKKLQNLSNTHKSNNPSIDNLNFDLDYSKILGTVPLLPTIENIRKYYAQRDILTTLLTEINNISGKIKNVNSSSDIIGQVNDQMKEFISRPELNEFVYKLLERQKITISLLDTGAQDST